MKRIVNYLLIHGLILLLSTPVFSQLIPLEDQNISALLGFDGEPYMAVDPTNPDHIVVAWMRVRLDSKLWIATKVTFDAGETWSEPVFQSHTDTDYNAYDVNLVFHSSGLVYMSYVDVRWSDTLADVFVTKSLDGGLSWESPVSVYQDHDTPDIPVDRPWLSIDNSGGLNDGTLYLSSMSYYKYDKGPHHVYLKTSSDSGKTWSALQLWDDSISVGSLLASSGIGSVGGDGKYYAAYASWDTSVNPFLRLIVGVTEDKGTTVNYKAVNLAFITVSSNYAYGYALAANPIDSNEAHLFWIDNRFGDADVVHSATYDGGKNWTAVSRINDDSVGNGIVQDRLWCAYSPWGRLSVAWRDRRDNDTGTTAAADFYMAYSTDNGVSFSENYRLSDSSAGHAALPCCNSFIGIAGSDSMEYVIWGEDRNTDWEIYMGKIRVLQDTSSLDSSSMILTYDDFPLQISPNPVRENLTISFELSSPEKVWIAIYTSQGKLVKSQQQQFGSGEQSIQLNVKSLAAGNYVCRLSGRGFISQKKLLILP